MISTIARAAKARLRVRLRVKCNLFIIGIEVLGVRGWGREMSYKRLKVQRFKGFKCCAFKGTIFYFYPERSRRELFSIFFLFKGLKVQMLRVQGFKGQRDYFLLTINYFFICSRVSKFNVLAVIFSYLNISLSGSCRVSYILSISI